MVLGWKSWECPFSKPQYLPQGRIEKRDHYQPFIWAWENLFLLTLGQRSILKLVLSIFYVHIIKYYLQRRNRDFSNSNLIIANFLAMKQLIWKLDLHCCCRSVAKSCLTSWDPTNRSTPGLPVHHQLPEFTQTHVHRVSDAIQPSHPLSSPSPALSLSQHQGLFQWVSSSCQEIGRASCRERV